MKLFFMVKGTKHHIKRALHSDGMDPMAFLANYLKSLNEGGWHIRHAEANSLDLATMESELRSPSRYCFRVHGAGRGFSSGAVDLIVTPKTPESKSAISKLYSEAWERIAEERQREEAQRLEAEKNTEERKLADLSRATGMKVTQDEDGGYNFD